MSRLAILNIFLSASLSICANAWSSTTQNSRVSILRFNQEASDVFANCRDWSFGMQDQLATQLAHALTQEGVTVLERRLGSGHGYSTITITAQLVSVETGAVVSSFTATGRIADEASNANVGIQGIGVNEKTRSRPAIEKASQIAIEDMARQIAKALKSGIRNS
jgi:hypothetical protein